MGIYSPDIRLEAAILVKTTGLSVAMAAKQLAMPKISMDNWMRPAKAGKVTEVGNVQRRRVNWKLNRHGRVWDWLK